MHFNGTGAQILVESMCRAGVDVIFGVPGDTGVALYDALRSESDRIRHVLANDERGAAFMADVFARRTNRVGAVEVSSGGGVTFAIGGLGEPYAASVPVFVVTSDISTISRGTGALTEIDQLQLFKAVTKWQAIAAAPADIPSLVQEGMRSATSGRPGPVVLIVPEDVLDEVGDADFDGSTPVHTVPAMRVSPDQAAIATVAAGLSAAAQPAIVAGSGIHMSAAYAELMALCEKAAVPVATTIHGKGAISELHPLALGIVGANGARPYANDYLSQADYVLFVGTRANATDTNGFSAPPRTGTTVAQIDIESTVAGRNYPDSTTVVADAREALAALAHQIPAANAATTKARTAVISAWKDSWERSVPVRRSDTHVDPQEALDQVRAACGDADVTIVSDCGTPTPYLASYWTITEPGRSLILARGHGPMGYAFPGSVGAALACPGKPVVAIVTDGSFLMAVGALETAHRMGLPITYVHLRNGTLGWIKALQCFHLDERYFSTDISSFDAVRIATGFGIDATRCESAASVAEAVRFGLSTGRPYFIDVPIPSEHETVPPVAAWVSSALGVDNSRPVY